MTDTGSLVIPGMGVFPTVEETEITAWPLRIGPQEAERLLARNESNRGLSWHRVQTFVDIIERGEWQLNGETIKVGPEGQLLDGQHRLDAIRRSGETVPVWVMFNVPPDARNTIDFTRTRTLADALRMKRVPNAAQVAATLNALLGYRTGKYSFSGNLGMTIPLGLRMYEESEGSIDETVRIANRMWQRMGIRTYTGILGAVIHVLYATDPDDADYFFEKLVTGEMLEPGSPILALRNRLYAQTEPYRKFSRKETAALLFKAWNLWRGGTSVDNLSYRAGGRNPEPFPQPV